MVFWLWLVFFGYLVANIPHDFIYIFILLRDSRIRGAPGRVDWNIRNNIGMEQALIGFRIILRR